jgi:hypothetical protein
MPEMMERFLRSRLRADECEVQRVLSDPDSKDYADLRDRAAYVYVTGSMPSHLRSLMTSLLARLATYSRTPVSFDRRVGSLALSQEMIERLDLESHPMVAKLRPFIDGGYRIQLERDMKARRPYTKVFLFNPGTGDRITVQIDGSLKEGWG